MVIADRVNRKIKRITFGQATDTNRILSFLSFFQMNTFFLFFKQWSQKKAEFVYFMF